MKNTNFNNYYTSKTKDFILYQGDALKVLKEIKKESVDMIFADPPYFLSNGGITCKSGKMVKVNKGNWDKKVTLEKIHEFNKIWIYECKKILKPNGTIFISGTYHNIYSLGFLLQEMNFKILNEISWFKVNPPPNLSCRYFTHATENIIWAKKNINAKHYFNYKLMKNIGDPNPGKQMLSLWRIKPPKKEEKKFGKHPTQKPIELLERIILASTKKGATILDPFSGSGTTGVASIKNGRKYIGIENSKKYLNISIKRVKISYGR